MNFAATTMQRKSPSTVVLDRASVTIGLSVRFHTGKYAGHVGTITRLTKKKCDVKFMLEGVDVVKNCFPLTLIREPDAATSEEVQYSDVAAAGSNKSNSSSASCSGHIFNDAAATIKLLENGVDLDDIGISWNLKFHLKEAAKEFKKKNIKSGSMISVLLINMALNEEYK